jgi:hypothetical protein
MLSGKPRSYRSSSRTVLEPAVGVRAPDGQDIAGRSARAGVRHAEGVPADAEPDVHVYLDVGLDHRLDRGSLKAVKAVLEKYGHQVVAVDYRLMAPKAMQMMVVFEEGVAGPACHLYRKQP